MHIKYAHDIWDKFLSPDDTVIDATCGNGHDTLFLAQKLTSGTLYAIDIQEKALQKTRERLGDLSPRVHFIHGSHETLPPSSPRLIVYNLGYLPGSDKSLTTQCNTTLKSLEGALKIIAPDGLISITCYPGHEEGAREEAMLLNFAASLTDFIVTHTRWLNRKKAPSLLIIKRPL